MEIIIVIFRRFKIIIDSSLMHILKLSQTGRSVCGKRYTKGGVIASDLAPAPKYLIRQKPFRIVGQISYS